MTQKIKYKIISYSSQERQYPVTSLLVPGSDGWQSKRFCNYPQQVTLEFYGIAHVDKIELLADSRKVASSVDILYYDPTEQSVESRFTKYGSLEFSRNEGGRIHEQKTVMVDMKCLYLRFLFHRPHKNKENFFSQVQIHQLVIYGNESNVMLPIQNMPSKKNSIPIDPKAIIEEQDEFVYAKLVQIQRKKQQAVMNEDFDEAERLKQIMMNVKKFGYKLKSLKEKKNEAADKEEYDLAKNIKDEIDRLKKEVDVLVSESLEGEQYDEDENRPEYEHDVQGNQFVGLEINKMLDRQGESMVSQKNSRVLNNSSTNRNDRNTDRNNYLQSSYDERIIPTLQKKIKTEESQVVNEDLKQQLAPAEQIDGSHATDASVMAEFFEQETVRQFFSKSWQHKERALTDIPVQASKKPQDVALLRCLIRIVAQSIGETNFKLSSLSLGLLKQVLKINAKTQKVNKSNIEPRDTQKILDQIIKKMADNNAKIRSSSEQLFNQMVESSLFGVDQCATSLMKASQNSKASAKQQAQKLASLSALTSKYGLGSNGVPESVVAYAVEKLGNPAAEVRTESINLLTVCASRNQNLVESQLQGKKATYLQQIEARQKEIEVTKPVKKK